MEYTIKGYNGKYIKYTVTGKAEKLFVEYSKIQTANDLRKNHLSLAEYHSIPYLLHDLAQNGKAQTFITGIKEWFAKLGCDIQPDKHGVNYCITL